MTFKLVQFHLVVNNSVSIVNQTKNLYKKLKFMV